MGHFRDLVYSEKVKAVVITGAGKNLCSGGDVSEIIGPLTKIMTKISCEVHFPFTRMARDIVKAIRNCRLPSIAAVDGICAGAGAILAMANNIKVWFPHLRSNSFFVKSVPYVSNIKVHLKTKI